MRICGVYELVIPATNFIIFFQNVNSLRALQPNKHNCYRNLLWQLATIQERKVIQNYCKCSGHSVDEFTLMDFSRIVIRRTLNAATGGSSILPNIDSLEIPVIIKDFLKLAEEIDLTKT